MAFLGKRLELPVENQTRSKYSLNILIDFVYEECKHLNNVGFYI